MKKNVAFFIGDFTRSGGTERSCITVANGLAKKNNNNIFLLASNTENEKSFFNINDDITILYLTKYNSKKDYFIILKQIVDQCRKNKIDIIVAVEMYSMLFVFPALLLGKLLRVKLKLVAWEHFNYNVTLQKPLRARFRTIAAKYADLIVVLTKRDVELWKNFGKREGAIQYIYNPSPFVKSEKKYNSTSKNIIAIGRLDHQKGFDKLLHIWKLFQDKNFVDWKLQIIGSGPDLIDLEKLIIDYKLGSSVEMIPNTTEIKSYYENAAFLIMTSRFEGLPMTLIEAQSNGLPIISYDFYTGPAEVITSASGFLVENDIEDMIVEKLTILCQDENLRLQMSENAKIESGRFSADNVIGAWETALDVL